MAEKTVEVTILGKTYELKTDGDTEIIKRAANLLNHKIEEIPKDSTTASSQTTLVLAALNLAEEYLLNSSRKLDSYSEAREKIIKMLSRIEKQVDACNKTK